MATISQGLGFAKTRRLMKALTVAGAMVANQVTTQYLQAQAPSERLTEEEYQPGGYL